MNFAELKLYIFNPENDLALADGGFSYHAPPSALRIAHDLATLPLWFADANDAVLLPDFVHAEYRNCMSQLFPLAQSYNVAMRACVDTVAPWGWSAQVRHRIKAMGFDASLLPNDGSIDAMRELSNRRLCIEVLSRLRDEGVDTPLLPCYFDNLAGALDFVKSNNRCVVKAPWSGSGKGIMWGIGRVEAPMEHFCKGVIRRQGGVVCEYFLNAVVEFAMEFRAVNGKVEFVGYSLFETEKGGYSGNLLLSNDDIEARVVAFVSLEELRRVRGLLCGIMQERLRDCCYEGFFGVDMMVYEEGGCYRINPCMEINLRMNMGVVARIFYDRFMLPGAQGRYFVKYFRDEGEASLFHRMMHEKLPASIDAGKIVKGYLNLSPVAAGSRYVAGVVVGENGAYGSM